MNLSRKSEYALLALIDLAERYDDRPAKTADIAARRHIPKKYLEQILLLLKGAGYARSTRGPEGGYALGRPPAKISLAEIVRLIDGAIAPVESVSEHFYRHTPLEANEKILGVFRDIRNYAARKLESTKLSSLV